MAYRNFFGIFGHRWISQYDIDYIYREFPSSNYTVFVEFAGECKDLVDCTGDERDVERITIGFKDGTNRCDPDPYTYDVDCPVDSQYIVSSAKSHFYARGKTVSHPQTRNEEPGVIARVRGTVREKLRHYLNATGLEASSVEGPEESLDILVNAMDSEGRKNLCRLLSNVERDGIKCVVQFRFDMSTVDQLQRLDTDMEVGDLGEVLELTEDDRD